MLKLSGKGARRYVGSCRLPCYGDWMRRHLGTWICIASIGQERPEKHYIESDVVHRRKGKELWHYKGSTQVT